ncbi:MBL fold metallo-hydrolase [Streptomyces sp. NBC_01233]|uniref:MBL fold metallo-hydrolase n=1 Tax=Streptomyces sp. NBC_01233 TaxID=2903787 RepID=UPI002E0ED2B1|nr:MBL fold metallo-hydrolase [Streptomyces sp. NBC_01233]
MTNENTQSIWLGDVEVIRVREWQGFFTSARDLVPDSSGLWEDNGHWLAPDHWQPEQGQAVMALQSWVLRSAGQTVLIDTGVGNGRERPHTPHFHHWQADFLGALASVGVHPEDVDVVVNTHLHADHVGWNTHDVGGEWVPAFPRARYLIPAADDFHFGPGNSRGKGRNPDDGLVYEDSIAPVHQAGQAVLWDGAHRIDEHLTLEPAPGHTPGSSVLRLASRGERAVFVGDLVHSPVQIVQPSCNSCFCMDPVQAAASRRRVLQRAADERELVVPAHFAGPGALNIRATADAFTPARWASWPASHDTAAPQHS